MKPLMLAVLALFCLPCAFAASAGPPIDPIRDPFVQPSDKAQALDRQLGRYADLGFSGVVFVAKDGLILLHKGYGIADRSSGQVISTRTPFPVGPLTRIFTATTVLRLQMEGKIDTNDPVTKYVPDFRDEPRGFATTVHDLLAGDPAGAVRLPEVLETASGEAFETCVAERVFVPARMRSSWFLGGLPASAVPIALGYSGPDATIRRLIRIPGFRTILPAFARGLRERAARLAPAPPPEDGIDRRTRGASGMVTTAGDLFLWNLAMVGSAFLSESARTQIFNPIDNTVSYGWRLERTARGTPRMASTGVLPGYESGFWLYPSDNLVVIVLSNNDMGWGEAVRRAAESGSLGRDYTPLAIIGGLVFLFFIMQGAMRRRVPYRKGRHPRIYP